MFSLLYHVNLDLNIIDVVDFNNPIKKPATFVTGFYLTSILMCSSSLARYGLRLEAATSMVPPFMMRLPGAMSSALYPVIIPDG